MLILSPRHNSSWQTKRSAKRVQILHNMHGIHLQGFSRHTKAASLLNPWSLCQRFDIFYCPRGCFCPDGKISRNTISKVGSWSRECLPHPLLGCPVACSSSLSTLLLLENHRRIWPAMDLDEDRTTQDSATLSSTRNFYRYWLFSLLTNVDTRGSL